MRYSEVTGYVAKLVREGDELLSWVRKKSSELSKFGVFAIDPPKGRFLEILARLQSPRRVLEIGSGVGYSALWFMRGMGSKGVLDAIEINPEVAKILESVTRKAKLQGRIRVHQEPALSVLNRLKSSYDLVFIDADKDEYPAYLDHALRLTRPGSTILADNMFWGGSTVRGEESVAGAKGVMEYTRRIFNDKRLSSLIVPLGDGLAVSYRIK